MWFRSPSRALRLAIMDTVYTGANVSVRDDDSRREGTHSWLRGRKTGYRGSSIHWSISVVGESQAIVPPERCTTYSDERKQRTNTTSERK